MRDKLDLTFQCCNGRVVTGLIFIASGVISFLFFFFAAVLSRILPPFQNQILCAIQNDRRCSYDPILFSFQFLFVPDPEDSTISEVMHPHHRQNATHNQIVTMEKNMTEITAT